MVRGSGSKMVGVGHWDVIPDSGWNTRQGWGSRHMMGFQTGTGSSHVVGYQTQVGYQTGMVGYQTDNGIPDTDRVPDMGGWGARQVG